MDVLVALGTNAAVSNLHLHGHRKLPLLLGILETQQSQLETLADEHKRQEERIKVEYEFWISGIRSLKDVIDKADGSFVLREKRKKHDDRARKKRKEQIDPNQVGVSLPYGNVYGAPAAGWKLWPFAHLITYGVIPVEQRLLWVDSVELIWVTILSGYSNEKSEARISEASTGEDSSKEKGS